MANFSFFLIFNMFLCFSSYVEPIIQPPFDDIDPEYGLHGYKLHIVLHDTVCKLMSESFSQLFCHRGNLFLIITSKPYCIGLDVC